MRPGSLRNPVIDVAVNILTSAEGRVLLAERTARQVAAGYWELPGGKIDAGESAAHAAARELAEEIGVRALELRPWGGYEHEFTTRRVRLHLFRVLHWDGLPHGREGQRLAWVDPAIPSVAPILPSNDRALRALSLPALFGVVRFSAESGAAQLQRIERAMACGLRLLQLRPGALAPDQRVSLARRTAMIGRRYGARVLLAGTALEARRAGVAGVHSSADALRRLAVRPPASIWTVSCHDAADLERATLLGADAAVLSPVLPSASHPDQQPFGWEGFARLAAAAPFPVYAQGGMTPGAGPQAAAAGAHGVALGIEALESARHEPAGSSILKFRGRA